MYHIYLTNTTNYDWMENLLHIECKHTIQVHKAPCIIIKYGDRDIYLRIQLELIVTSENVTNNSNIEGVSEYILPNSEIP